MKNITKLSMEETMELHKELWTNIAILINESMYRKDLDWTVSDLKQMALQPILEKEGFIIGLVGDLTYPVSNCFLCQYRQNEYMSSKILYCLGSKDGLCHVEEIGCLDGLYDTFTDAIYKLEFEKVLKIAKEIANLPLTMPSRDENKS